MTATLESRGATASGPSPAGVPFLRDRFLARTGLYRCSLDPDATPGDPGLFGPGSATWSLVGQHPQPLAGLRAALLQALSAPIPTATASTGTFDEDFLGRVQRTGVYVQAQNFGSLDEVFRSARRVRAMHRTVSGTSKEGVTYDATDPHLTAWVSMTMTDSVLAMTERFGTGPVAPEVADAFVREQAVHAALLDHRVDLAATFDDPERRAALRAGELPLPLVEEGELPTTLAGLRERMAAHTPELSTTRMTRKRIDRVVKLDRVPSRQRRLLLPFVLATLDTVDDTHHELLAPDSDRAAERRAARRVRRLFALIRTVVGEPPLHVTARARAAA
ncbi:MAG: oxygenase MpaB family protein [Actinomycetota bacterium]|nr:oxygenase MpaB family protein [Actinomycetota bacterium]